MLTLSVVDQRTWHRARARLMGTVAELLIDGPAEIISSGFRRLRELESTLSRFIPDSELEQLNRSGGRWIDVSPELFAALRWCERLYEETDGLFDPTIRTALEHAGYDRSFSSGLDDDTATPLPPLQPRPVPAKGTGCIELSSRAIRRARLINNARLDLGGVGKGLAVDLVANELVAAGARCAFVSLGGDSHAAGEPPEAGSWPVPLLHPVDDHVVATHPLVNGGLVMSSPLLRQWRRGDVVHHHLIDPRTARSAATDVVAVAVAARSAARAEGLAKAAVIAGEHDGIALLKRCHVTAWMVTRSTVTPIDAGSQ